MGADDCHCGEQFGFGDILVLITNTFAVILRRLFMEMRVYEEVPPYRALYLHSAHCWGRTSLAQLRAAVQLALWWLTIVGGVIKTFSYYLCSFILAENPTMKGKDAIALSRKMMNGHKWECFLMELSFVPWHLLSMATFGLTDLFYASAYITATRCEFYAAVRAQVKAKGEAEALRDTYLFERATAKTLRRAYNDLGKPVEKLPERVYGNRVSRFFGEYLGVTLFVNRRMSRAKRFRIANTVCATCAAASRGFPTRFGSAHFCSMSTKIENPPCLRANIR